MIDKLQDLLQNEFVWIAITFIVYRLGIFISSKFKTPIINATVVTLTILILLLYFTKIPYETYDLGGKYIGIFLVPATALLAFPLYRVIGKLKDNIPAIVVGAGVGSVASILTVIGFGRLLKIDDILILSLAPKSVTTPIAIELSALIGGIPSLTVAAVIVAGITGAVLTPSVCKLCGIRDRVALGAAIGTSSHVLGTSRALEIGELEGSVSSICIGVAGIITAIVLPLII